MLAALLALLLLVAAGCDGNEEAVPPPETTGPVETTPQPTPEDVDLRRVHAPGRRDCPASQDGRVHARCRPGRTRGADDRPDRHRGVRRPRDGDPRRDDAPRRLRRGRRRHGGSLRHVRRRRRERVDARPRRPGRRDAHPVPHIERVAFRLDGEPVETIGGEGVVVDPPIGRTAIEEQSPQILIESPLPEDTVTSPIRLRGTANVYEATVSIEVRDETGAVVYEGFTTATSGTGTRGTFDTTVPLKDLEGPMTIVAFEASAEDGRPLHVAKVPVTLAP